MSQGDWAGVAKWGGQRQRGETCRPRGRKGLAPSRAAEGPRALTELPSSTEVTEALTRTHWVERWGSESMGWGVREGEGWMGDPKQAGFGGGVAEGVQSQDLGRGRQLEGMRGKRFVL